MLVNGECRPILPWGTKTSPHDNTTVSRQGGKIVVDAGKGNDQINVRQVAPGQYGVNVNGVEHTFSRAEMNRLEIRGGKGHDNINIDPSVDIPINVDGGKGNDRINNFANGANINGGKGNDVIFNRASGTNISGGRGRDQIDNAGNYNNIQGNRGNDQISSRGNGNTVNGGRGNDDVWSRGWGNNVSGGPGLFDRVQNSTPWMGSCGCFGGWNNLGNLAYNSGFSAGYQAGMRDGWSAGFNAGFGSGGFWNNAAAFGVGAWGLDISAAINVNVRL